MDKKHLADGLKATKNTIKNLQFLDDGVIEYEKLHEEYGKVLLVVIDDLDWAIKQVEES